VTEPLAPGSSAWRWRLPWASGAAWGWSGLLCVLIASGTLVGLPRLSLPRASGCGFQPAVANTWYIPAVGSAPAMTAFVSAAPVTGVGPPVGAWPGLPRRGGAVAARRPRPCPARCL